MAALVTVHDFSQAGIALVGDVASVGEHPVFLIHALKAILLIVVEIIQILIVIEMGTAGSCTYRTPPVCARQAQNRTGQDSPQDF